MVTEKSTTLKETSEAYDNALAEEQRYLNMALDRRAAIVRHLDSEHSVATSDGVAQIRQQRLARQLTELDAAENALIFGRLDAADGTAHRIGRIGISSSTDEADPLVIDWRAPAARPFYMATPVEPLGQARRRHIRVEGHNEIGIAH